MTQGDWLTVGAVLIGCGPYVGALVYITWCAIRAHGKDEV